MPLPESKLQNLLILGRFLLPKVFGLHVQMLHHSVPHRMDKKTPTTKTNPAPKPPKECEEPEQEPKDVQVIDQDTDIRPAVRSISRSVPSTANFGWTSVEMDLINLDNTLAHRQVYTQYIRRYQDKQLQVRSFKAFLRKKHLMQS